MIFFLVLINILQGCQTKNTIEKDCSTDKAERYLKLTELNGNTNSLLEEYINCDSNYAENVEMRISSLEFEVKLFRMLIEGLNEPFIGEDICDKNKSVIRCLYLSRRSLCKCVSIIKENQKYKIVAKDFSFRLDEETNIEIPIIEDSLVFDISRREFDQVIKDLHNAYFWDITRNVKFQDIDPEVFIMETLLCDEEFEYYPRYHKVKKDNPIDNSFGEACNALLQLSEKSE